MNIEITIMAFIDGVNRIPYNILRKSGDSKQ